MEYYGDKEGQVFNTNNRKIKAWDHSDGYLMFRPYYDKNSRTSNTYIHRFIYEYHRGKIPKGMEINHINENKKDNRLENLELVTKAENIRKRSYNKLSLKKCRCIRQQYKDTKITQQQLATEYNCDQSTINYCIKGKTWS
jgi:hypothetical protein